MRLAADENFHGTTLKQLHKRLPVLDIVRVQDTEMYQQPDPIVLGWAARENRIILTHDVHTLVGDAYERINKNLPMPGVIFVPDKFPIGKALEDLEYVLSVGEPEDFENHVIFIPLNQSS
jgi:hypothetical protein